MRMVASYRWARVCRWRIVAISLLCLAGSLAVSTESFAKKDHKSKKDPESWSLRLDVDESFTDNVKWSGSGGLNPKESDYYTTVGTNLEWKDIDRPYFPDKITTVVRARFYDEFTDRDFVEISPEFTYDLGRTDIMLRYSYIPRQLLLDEDTTIDPNNPADVFSVRHRIRGTFQHKFGYAGHWRARLILEGRWVRSLNSVDERDSFTPVAGVELRYRPTSWFVPRVRLQYGERDTHDNNFDRNEFDIAVGLQSQFARYFRFQVRYKRGIRDYSVDELISSDGTGTNSNFRRNDDSDQYRTKLEFVIPGLDGLALTAHFRYRKNHSTRSTRNFTIREGGLGVAYTFR